MSDCSYSTSSGTWETIHFPARGIARSKRRKSMKASHDLNSRGSNLTKGIHNEGVAGHRTQTSLAGRDYDEKRHGRRAQRK